MQMRGGASLATLGALFALVACGGGGGSAGTPAPAPPPPGVSPASLSVALAGGASPNVDHLWVTVTGVAMNQDPARAFGDGDPSWVVAMLDAPVTVDLAGSPLGQGQALSLFKRNFSEFGTYAQLRLLVASSDPDAQLADSAKALGLARNDLVQYTDAIGTHIVPLEIPDLQAGLRADTPFTLSAGSITPLALEWNARDGIVHRQSSLGGDRYVVRNELQLYNQQLLTALQNGLDPSLFDSITGQLDTTSFCTAGSQPGCIRDVVATATSIAPGAAFHRAVRSVNVAANGSFVLYPLPSDSVYDVVIRGENMQTIVVRDVFVDPTGILKPFPTTLGTPDTPIEPVLDLTGRSVALAQPLAPTGSRVFFGQTVTGSGGGLGGADVPYELVTANADPFTGSVVDRITVAGGPLHVAVFDPKVDGVGPPPPFTTVSSTEGDGAFSVWSQGTLFDSTSAIGLLAAAATSVAAPDPLPLPDFTPGTLTVNLAGASSNGADRGELIVSNDGGTVLDLDVSAQLAPAAPVTVSPPSGTSTAVPGAAWYGVALRTWNSGNEAGTTRWVRASAPIDLASTSTASVTLTLP
jgi:hypothetical protein